ncbi:TPA: hypothetical protein SIA35_004003 [Aeromonas sobria]|nr:hypothetical protein [Aeromonas sobria]
MKRVFVLLFFSLFDMTGASRAATTANTTISATINTATCDVTVDKATVIIPAIDGTAIVGQDKILTSHQDLNVSLTCSGVFGASANPKINVTGEKLTGTGLSTDGAKLYRGSASTSKGFGIALTAKPTTGNSTFTDIITVLPFTKVTTIQTKAMQVAIGCGSAADCALANLTAGSLTAALTFTYAPQ